MRNKETANVFSSNTYYNYYNPDWHPLNIMSNR